MQIGKLRHRNNVGDTIMGLGDIVYEKIEAMISKEAGEMESLMSQIKDEMPLARAGGTVTGLKRALKLIKALLVEEEEDY